MHDPRASPDQKRQAIEDLTVGNFRFIRQYAARACPPSSVEFEDVHGLVWLGAVKAVHRWIPSPIAAEILARDGATLDDSTRSRLEKAVSTNTGRFVTYARWWMMQHVLERIQDGRGANITPPMRKLLHKYRAALRDLCADPDTEPTHSAIQERLGVDDITYRRLIDIVDAPLHLGGPVAHREDTALDETLASADEPIEDTIDAIAYEDVVVAAMRDLPKRYRRIVQIRSGLASKPGGDGRLAPLTLEQTAHAFQLVRQQVATHEERGMLLITETLLKLRAAGVAVA